MPKATDDTRLVTLLVIIIGAFIIIPAFVMGFGMMGPGPMMGGTWSGHMWGNGTMPGWMLFVGIVMQLLFLAVIVGGGYLVYKTVVGSQRDSDPVLEELRLAYARGELTDDEYEQRRETLERDRDSR